MEANNRINETTVTWLKYEGEFNFNSPKISNIKLIHEKNDKKHPKIYDLHFDNSQSSPK